MCAHCMHVACRRRFKPCLHTACLHARTDGAHGRDGGALLHILEGVFFAKYMVRAQTARMGVTAEREQYERALQKQSRLTAAAEAHARHCADRDRFVRELAAKSGVGAQHLPPTGPLSPAHVGT